MRYLGSSTVRLAALTSNTSLARKPFRPFQADHFLSTTHSSSHNIASCLFTVKLIILKIIYIYTPIPAQIFAMSNQGYYGGQQQQHYPQQGGPQYPQQAYGGPPQGGQYYPPGPGMNYQQNPPNSGRPGGAASQGCLGACLAALCCCCVAEEACETCADCAACAEGCC